MEIPIGSPIEIVKSDDRLDYSEIDKIKEMKNKT